MEGITGVTNWEEVDHNKSAYAQFQKQMSLEVAAACEGVISAGAKEILVKEKMISKKSMTNLLIKKQKNNQADAHNVEYHFARYIAHLVIIFLTG